MATVQLPAEQRIRFHDVSWQGYEALLKEFDEQPIRVTYDQGELEIMVVSHGHEHYGGLIGRFIEALTEELDIPIHSGKSTTFKREAEERGLEPDECYWIANESKMRGRKDFDISTDPPPDLAVEVEISRSALNRMSIYATLGVPEVWRFDGKHLYVHRLGANGKYRLVETSPTFPDLLLSELLRFLGKSDTVDETTLLRSFRKWVRKNVLPAWEKRKRPASHDQKANGKRKAK